MDDTVTELVGVIETSLEHLVQPFGQSLEDWRSSYESALRFIRSFKQATQRQDQICLDKFIFLNKLGQGSFGSVWKVQLHQNFFALKEVNCSDPKYCDPAEVFAERDIMRRLAHKNIVGLFATFFERDHAYFLMELCLGSVRVYLSRIKGAHLALFSMQLLEALSYMRSLRIVHRDLKPENLVIDTLGQLKVADFGLAMKLPEGSQRITDGRKGTYEYLPYEAIKRGEWSLNTDIYSAACIIYEMDVHSPLISCQTCQQFNLKGERINFYVAAHERGRIKEYRDMYGNIQAVFYNGRPVREPIVERSENSRFRCVLRAMLNRDWLYRSTPDDILNHPGFRHVCETLQTFRALATAEQVINDNGRAQTGLVPQHPFIRPAFGNPTIGAAFLGFYSICRALRPPEIRDRVSKKPESENVMDVSRQTDESTNETSTAEQRLLRYGDRAAQFANRSVAVNLHNQLQHEPAKSTNRSSAIVEPAIEVQCTGIQIEVQEVTIPHTSVQPDEIIVIISSNSVNSKEAVTKENNGPMQASNGSGGSIAPINSEARSAEVILVSIDTRELVAVENSRKLPEDKTSCAQSSTTMGRPDTVIEPQANLILEGKDIFVKPVTANIQPVEYPSEAKSTGVQRSNSPISPISDLEVENSIQNGTFIPCSKEQNANEIQQPVVLDTATMVPVCDQKKSAENQIEDIAVSIEKNDQVVQINEQQDGNNNSNKPKAFLVLVGSPLMTTCDENSKETKTVGGLNTGIESVMSVAVQEEMEIVPCNVVRSRPKASRNIKNSNGIQAEKIKTKQILPNNKAELLSPDKKVYRCSICKKTFSLLGNKNRHEKAHNPDSKFPCQFCRKVYQRKIQRDEHELSNHGDGNFHPQCRFCLKTFGNRNKLNYHLKKCDKKKLKRNEV